MHGMSYFCTPGNLGNVRTQKFLSKEKCNIVDEKIPMHLLSLVTEICANVTIDKFHCHTHSTQISSCLSQNCPYHFNLCKANEGEREETMTKEMDMRLTQYCIIR